MKKISIIVPIYNAERHLEECINSIVGQSYKNIEIILINDGSTDSSERIVSSFLENHDNIRYISQYNSGPSKTRNKGLQYASGDYIMFVDSDDYLSNTICERLIAHDADIVMCKSYKFKNGDKFETDDFASVTHIRQISDIGFKEFETLYKNTQFNPPFCKLYKKSLITTLFKEDLDLGEDIIFNFEYLKNCQTFMFLDEALYYYRVGDANSLSNKFDDKRIEKVHIVYEETSRLCTEIFGNNFNINLLKSNFLRESCICIKKLIVSNQYGLTETRERIKSDLALYKLVDYVTSDWENESLSFKLFFYLIRKKMLFSAIITTVVAEQLKGWRQ
ncbi:TPA: glycosyltransferase family 2 protein [Streptococcus suis]